MTCKAETITDYIPVIEKLQQPVWIYDFDNTCVNWGNAASLDVWQAKSLEELQSRDFSKDMTDTVQNRLSQYRNDFLRDESVQFREMWTLYPNGEPQNMKVVFSGILMEDGRMGMLCEALSESQLDNDALRSAEALLHTSVMITLYSASGEPLYRNPAARTAAKTHDESLTSHFVSDATTGLLLNATEEEVNTVASVQTASGTAWHDITARRCLDSVTGDHAWLISEVDVSRLKATEEHAQFLAEHDTLTGLPNRNHVTVEFQNRLDKILAADKKAALVFIDLDHFKDVNDTLGHDAGDQLLIAVADRLKNVVRSNDAVARLGGDEFLLIISPVADEAVVETVVKRIQAELPKPIVLQSREICITPSIGISLCPDNGRNINDLMRHADLAMYHAKENGRNNYSFFSQNLSEAVESRINLESELMTALEEGQFTTHFQPRVSIHDDTITGAEALVRWEHPEKGLISPGTFIPACEASGLIGELGKYVLRHAVLAQVEWAKAGHDIRISVNLSPLQFGEDTLVDDLADIVKSNNGNPEFIELEITESVLLGHDQTTIDKLHELVNHGFRIAIDDFGTGYSNLAYLHRYPIDCLKIDRSFIMQIDSVRPIVELIVSMARLFELDVVAEGVETEEQLHALQNFDCQEYQGFLFAKPMPIADFTALLAQHKQKAAA